MQFRNGEGETLGIIILVGKENADGISDLCIRGRNYVNQMLWYLVFILITFSRKDTGIPS